MGEASWMDSEDNCGAIPFVTVKNVNYNIYRREELVLGKGEYSRKKMETFCL